MTQTEKEQEALDAIQHSTDDQLYEMEEIFAGEQRGTVAENL